MIKSSHGMNSTSGFEFIADVKSRNARYGRMTKKSGWCEIWMVYRCGTEQQTTCKRNRRQIDRIKSGGSAFWWPWIPARDSEHHPTAAWFWIHYTQPTSPLVVIITISEPTWAKQDVLVASCQVTKCLYQSDPYTVLFQLNPIKLD